MTNSKVIVGRYVRVYYAVIRGFLFPKTTIWSVQKFVWELCVSSESVAHEFIVLPLVIKNNSRKPSSVHALSKCESWNTVFVSVGGWGGGGGNEYCKNHSLFHRRISLQQNHTAMKSHKTRISGANRTTFSLPRRPSRRFHNKSKKCRQKN